jgi:prepilin-type processing-associated H-X9-DG protein
MDGVHAATMNPLTYDNLMYVLCKDIDRRHSGNAITSFVDGHASLINSSYAQELTIDWGTLPATITLSNGTLSYTTGTPVSTVSNTTVDAVSNVKLTFQMLSGTTNDNFGLANIGTLPAYSYAYGNFFQSAATNGSAVEWGFQNFNGPIYWQCLGYGNTNLNNTFVNPGKATDVYTMTRVNGTIHYYYNGIAEGGGTTAWYTSTTPLHVVCSF